ncbi:MAG: aldehyde dehydrogenase family protein [Planctomycetota bacterium]|nr:aldehyde dehydrogenase family protein [Planctomycetota bacterium]MDA1113818.1 aldehyde dehydrogenase family protein [Planctomycetota bacterium]
MSVDRLPVLKTYKLFLGGAFPRTESGRSWPIEGRKGEVFAHLCLGSRKDLRNAVVAARKAQDGWSRRDAYNRGQVLYRMAEMLEGKTAEFASAMAETVPGGVRRARKEVEAAVDRLVAYAGWADKFSQVLGCNNPVAGPFYNFTVAEAMGVVGVVAPKEEALLGLVSLLAPVLVAGNTAIVIGSETDPLATALFGEVCATSDVPPGVVNLITGKREELLEVMATHRDIDGLAAAQCSKGERILLESGIAENLKRVTIEKVKGKDWYDVEQMHSPYRIQPFVEMKTIWHPSGS